MSIESIVGNAYIYRYFSYFLYINIYGSFNPILKVDHISDASQMGCIIPLFGPQMKQHKTSKRLLSIKCITNNQTIKQTNKQKTHQQENKTRTFNHLTHKHVFEHRKNRSQTTSDHSSLHFSSSFQKGQTSSSCWFQPDLTNMLLKSHVYNPPFN